MTVEEEGKDDEKMKENLVLGSAWNGKYETLVI